MHVVQRNAEQLVRVRCIKVGYTAKNGVYLPFELPFGVDAIYINGWQTERFFSAFMVS